jgi:hypothetical protein
MVIFLTQAGTTKAGQMAEMAEYPLEDGDA